MDLLVRDQQSFLQLFYGIYGVKEFTKSFMHTKTLISD